MQEQPCQQDARRSKERTYPELLRNRRRRFVGGAGGFDSFAKMCGLLLCIFRLPYFTVDGKTCQTPISICRQDSIGAILGINCWTLDLHNWLARKI